MDGAQMIIDRRYNGPPSSGNGGYSAGLLAHQLTTPAEATPAEVTLRRPPPLDTPLKLRRLTDQPYPPGTLGAFDGAELIAYAHPASVDDDPVAVVDPEQAARVAQTYRGFETHPFPTCYVCGPLREDGLRIFPGRLDATRTAAPFSVPAQVSTVTVWAALDCPGGWTVPQEDRAYVLGRIAARVDQVPEPGETCVVVGERRGESGRKVYVATSLYRAGGELLATARATWLAI